MSNAQRQVKYWPFRGGLDVVTPPITVEEGRMIAGRNYEPWINGGYRRIAGYERYDGQEAPSDATWRGLELLSPLVPPSGELDPPMPVPGDTVTGLTSGATGKIVYISEALNRLFVTRLTGAFLNAEELQVGGMTVGVLNGLPSAEYADSTEESNMLRLLVESEYRDVITQVPGLNPIRGIWQIKDRVYAFRDEPGGTFGVVHKATPSGWDTAPFEYTNYVQFDTGTAEPDIGATITGGSSGATGVVHKVILHTGSWGGGDAAGYFLITSAVGLFSAAEAITGYATTSAASEVFVLPPGGKYDFVTQNFLGGASTYRVYCANGVGPAFEIDENDIISPILLDTTMGDSPDENNPYLCEVYKGALWLAFPGGSLQKSVTGQPLVFNGFLGATEYGLSDEITAITSTAGDVLVAHTRRQTHGIYGTGAKIISDRAGALPYSTGELSSLYSSDDSGIVDLRRVESFGDFANATISDAIQPIAVAGAERITGVLMIRSSNQYRVCYDNGEGIIARMRPDGQAEFGLFSYPDSIYCAYSCEAEDGSPTNWFGGDQGYVFQTEKGRNFDGEPIESSMRLPFNHQGQPQTRKRYRLAEIELEAERDLSLLVAAELSYAGSETGSWSWEDSVIGGGGYYDADNWDEIYWDAQQFNTARFELLGTGRNISLLFYHSSATTEPFILQGCQLHFDNRRVQR